MAVSSGVGAVPSDFKALKFAYVNESPAKVLQWVTLDELYRDYPNRSGASTPSVISREGANFTFGPHAKDFTLSGIYYAKQDFIRDTDPSWYATNAPEVLLYGALLEAAPFIVGDERIPVWQQFFTDAVAALKVEENNSAISMGPLSARTDANPHQP